MCHADSQCNGKSGNCQDDRYNTCAGQYQSGLCSGGSNRRCCLQPDDSKCTYKKGNCQNDGHHCAGKYQSGLCDGVTSRRCCLPPTPVHGRWNSFGAWTTCSGNTRKRTRTCNNPSPKNGGDKCSGSATETQSCDAACTNKKGNCQNDGYYCAGKYQSNMCSGPNNRRCCLPPTPVHGRWSDWGVWTTCFMNERERKRTCTRPAPEYGGNTCVGSDTYTDRECDKKCNNKKGKCQISGFGCTGEYSPEYLCSGGNDRRCCLPAKSVHGKWSNYGAWSTCSGREQTQTRTCTKPAPKYGGNKCSGSATKTRSCDAVVINIYRKITIQDDSTLGYMTMAVNGATKHTFHTLEPPWRNNDKSTSAIAVGTYIGSWTKQAPAQKFPGRYVLKLGTSPTFSIAGERTHIIIGHNGNSAADTEGCVIIGSGTTIGRQGAGITGDTFLPTPPAGSTFTVHVHAPSRTLSTAERNKLSGTKHHSVTTDGSVANIKGTGYTVESINGRLQVILDKPCTVIGGTCQTNSLPCGGGYQPDLCSGGSNRRCCMVSTPTVC